MHRGLLIHLVPDLAGRAILCVSVHTHLGAGLVGGAQVIINNQVLPVLTDVSDGDVRLWVNQAARAACRALEDQLYEMQRVSGSPADAQPRDTPQ
jgi:hypothetical protein